MKRCKHCDVELNRENWRYIDRQRPAYTCRQCDRDIANKRKRISRAYVAQYKLDKGCERCGYNKTHYALDLCHIDRETKTHCYKTNRSAYNQNWAPKRLEEELAKCKVLCSNCHREETALENGWEKYDGSNP